MDLIQEISKRGTRAKNYLYTRTEEIIFPKDPLRLSSEHYLRSGGKGFRPAMLQLVCGALEGDEERALPVAAAIEAVHVSSLVHDDYMDQDKTRRGVEAVWVKWNPTIAILAGDVMVGLAFQISGDLDLPVEMRYEISRGLANIYTRLCTGQMHDLKFETTDFADLSVEDITHMQYLKTGVLFEFACVTGARIALRKMEDEMIEVVREYAKLSGTAFQIQDDIIGLIGDEEEVGKPIGSDIRQGKRTLIAVHAYTHANEEQKERLMRGLGNTSASAEEIAISLAVMKETGSIKYAQDLAIEMGAKAEKLTERLPRNDNTALLKEFARYMVERKY